MVKKIFAKLFKKEVKKKEVKKEDKNKEDEEKVKARLKALGYI